MPILGLGLALGVRFESGPAGVALFVALGLVFGVAMCGIPYALALRTRDPAVVGSSFLIFYPFLLLTTTFVPEEHLSGWVSTAAKINPITYVLAALRSLVDGRGIDWRAIGSALIAIGGTAVAGLALCAAGVRSHTRTR